MSISNEERLTVVLRDLVSAEITTVLSDEKAEPEKSTIGVLAMKLWGIHLHPLHDLL